MTALATVFTFDQSKFAPVAIGFFGLGVGYFVWGGTAVFGFPRTEPGDAEQARAVTRTLGLWGIWMPGFMQFLTGVYLTVGITWFQVFTKDKQLYLAALAFTAYGVHWFVLGHKRYISSSAAPDGWMAIPFAVLSVLGVLVFWHAGDRPVVGLFVGLTLIYLTEIPTRFTGWALGERIGGLWQLATGGWLMYLTLGAVLELTNDWHILF
ncbi:MAG: hypothetical protein ACXVRA_11310 [Gaiellaceae bacterium]